MFRLMEKFCTKIIPKASHRVLYYTEIRDLALVKRVVFKAILL